MEETAEFDSELGGEVDLTVYVLRGRRLGDIVDTASDASRDFTSNDHLIVFGGTNDVGRGKPDFRKQLNRLRNIKNCEMVEHYKNILNDIGHNDFQWISRSIDFTETYKQERPQISPYDFKLLVLSSPNLHYMIKKINKEKSDGCNGNKIVNILTEIGFDYNLSVIRWLGYILVKILRKSLSGLYVNEDKLRKIKSEMGSSPVVFVPTHRSYGDFILMAFICFKYNINVPCVAAGMDFLSMKFMSNILRKSKAFFMRRKFADDPMYRTVFKEYIKILISYQNSPVEFFIEGTRSRTGKSLMPKFGFLNMLIDAFLSCEIPDLKIVPINISYERILEDNLFAYELMGIPKPKESTSGLLKGLRLMRGNYGNIFVTFGDSLSIRDFIQEEGDFRFTTNEYENIKIKEIGYRIIEMQQNLQTFGSFNLIALILNSTYIKTGSYRIPLQDAIKQFEWLLVLFNHFGASVCFEGNIENSIIESIKIHNSLTELSNNNIYLKLVGEEIHATPSARSAAEYHLKYVPYIRLQIYINPSLNLFARASIIILILNESNGIQKILKDTLHESYQYLCNIFKYEFVLDGLNNKAFDDCISQLNKLQIIETQSIYIGLNPNISSKNFFIELILPFIVGMYFICKLLNNFQDHVYHKDQQGIKKIIQAHIEEQIKEGSFPYHYCTSVDFISNSFNSLLELHVITKCYGRNEFAIDRRTLNIVIGYLGSLIKQEDIFRQLRKLDLHKNGKIQAKL